MMNCPAWILGFGRNEIIERSRLKAYSTRRGISSPSLSSFAERSIGSPKLDFQVSDEKKFDGIGVRDLLVSNPTKRPPLTLDEG